MKTTPLSEEGQEQVSRLKDTLAHLELQPEVFLTSCGYTRVDKTAERLSAGTSKPIHPIMALNPLEETCLTNENILSGMGAS